MRTTRRPLITLLFVATAIATTAAHCEAPPVVRPESATLELLNGPNVTAGDTLRFRAGLNDEVAPATWTLLFASPDSSGFVRWFEEFPEGECSALSETPIPNADPAVEFSAEVECVLPTWVDNGTWHVSVVFDGAKYGPTVPFDVTGGSDDRSGPTVQFTEFPTQPVVAGQSFEVAARVVDPNGVAFSETALDFTLGPGPRPLCEPISDVPYPSFDIEVRYRCDTTTRSAGTYRATLTAFDLLWRSGQTSTRPTVTIISGA